MKRSYDKWEHKWNVPTYRIQELSPKAAERAVRNFNRACGFPEGYEPDYCEICAEVVRFTKTGIVWSC